MLAGNAACVELCECGHERCEESGAEECKRALHVEQGKRAAQAQPREEVWKAEQGGAGLREWSSVELREQSSADPRGAPDPCRAVFSGAEQYGAKPSRAEPSRAVRSQAAPCGAKRSQAKQCRAVPSSAEQFRAVPSSTEQYGAVQSRTEPCRAMLSRASGCSAVQSSVEQCRAVRAGPCERSRASGAVRAEPCERSRAQPCEWCQWNSRVQLREDHRVDRNALEHRLRTRTVGSTKWPLLFKPLHFYIIVPGR